MIHIVEGLGTPADQPLLESMFEDRKRLFIDLLDWDLTVVDDRLEVDRFDDAYATYIIAADRAGRHLASMRLLPSTRPHLLGTQRPVRPPRRKLLDGDVDERRARVEIEDDVIAPVGQIRQRLDPRRLPVLIAATAKQQDERHHAEHDHERGDDKRNPTTRQHRRHATAATTTQALP